MNLKKQIAVFFLVIFFPTLLPINLLYASNNGPNASDFSSFEPVDAADMVNLVTGDMTYVLPLLNVPSPEGGYPLALSYHAGIAMDQEASWAGLGWSINPGAINRNANGYPDDIRLALENTFSYDVNSATIYKVGLGANIYGVSLGVGASWGSNKAFGGTVSLGYGPVSVSGGEDGIGIGVGYSGNVQNLSSGASLFSRNSNGYLSAGTGISSTSSNSSFTKDNYNVNVVNKGIDINAFGFSFYTGRTDINYGLFSNDAKEYTGVLYPLGSINSVHTNRRLSDANKLMMFSHGDNMLNQVDIERHYKYDNSLSPNFDKYFINSQGLNGSITPTFLEEVPLYYPSVPMESQANHLEYSYTTTGNASYFQNLDQRLILNNKFFFEFEGTSSSYLRVNRTNIYRDINAENANTNNIDLVSKAFIAAKTSNNNEFNQDSANGIPLKAGSRKRSGRYIETFTNKQIADQTTNGWFLEAANLNRSIANTYDLDGIGAFRVTDVDGKVYHYSLPVINHEIWYKNHLYNDENASFVERENDKAFATDWLLTAVTGPDYVDINRNNKVDNADIGYWVEFDYGKWSDGYIWNSSGASHDLVKGGRDSYATYEYYRGRKQIFYLDAIKTRTHTAYFIKSLRQDAMGEEYKFYSSPASTGNFDPYGNSNTFSSLYGEWSLSYGSDNSSYPYINAATYGLPTITSGGDQIEKWFGYKKFLRYADFPKHYSLKIDKIVLVKNGTVTINKSSGRPLRTDIKAYLYKNKGFQGTQFIYRHGTNAYYEYSDGLYLANPNVILQEINIHQSQNVLDVNDVTSLNLNSKAEKVIEFTQDYLIAPLSPNSVAFNQSKLRLTSVNFLGKKGVHYIPPYKFQYHQYGDTYDESKKDAWGYHQNAPTAGNLSTIQTPTGGKISIGYEHDDYSAVAAKVSRLFNSGMRFYISKNTSTNELFFSVSNNTEAGDSEYTFEEIKKCFSIGEKIALDFFVCRRGKYGGHRRQVTLNIDQVQGEIVSVNNNNIIFKIPDNVGYWYFDDQDEGWILNRSFSYTSVRHGDGSNDGVIIRDRAESCWGWRDSYDNDDICLAYRLASSNTSNNEKGGGVRVSSISFYNAISPYSNLTEKRFYYNKPGYDRSTLSPSYLSSGITSYAPSSDPLIIPYASEIPPPLVMYKNVTVEERGRTGNVLKRTDYEFETLEPYQVNSNNIYNVGNHLQVKRLQSESPIAGSELKFSKYHISSKTSDLGRLISRKTYNTVNQLISSSSYRYKRHEDVQGEIGVKQESYISKYSDYAGPSKWYVNSLSKTWYPSTIESIAETANGYTNTVFYDKFDFLTGEVLETRFESSDGTQLKTAIVPAYTKYSGMGAKVDNISDNRNMLVQPAMAKAYVYNSALNTWKETGVGITTWSNLWSYRTVQGSTVTPTASKEKIWRKYRTYTWNGAVDADGTLQGYTGGNDDDFNWSIGVGTVPQTSEWQQTSEVTLYDNFSNILEFKDVSGNLSSQKVNLIGTLSAKGAAGYGELFYFGGELVGTYPEHGIFVINCSRITDLSFVHTGKYSLRTDSSSQLGILMKAGDHRAGKYKLSVWVHKSNADNARIRFGSNTLTFDPESYSAGDWVLKTKVLDVPVGDYSIYVNSFGGYVLYDDIRIHPVNAAMTTYVYNEWDELTEILDRNNIGQRFEYDAGGRIIKIFQEVIDQTGQISRGGFKLQSKNIYYNAYDTQ